MAHTQRKEDPLIDRPKLEILYRNHLRGAYVRIGASLVMWVFLLCSFIFGVIAFDTLANGTICIAYLILINPLVLFLLKRLRERRQYENFSLLINFLEIIGYTAIIYVIGGIKASFLSLQYVALISYVGVISPRRTPFLIATIASVCFVSMVLLDYLGIIPHQNTLTELVYNLKTQIMIAMVVVGYLYIIAFISSSIGSRLRRGREKLEESERRYREYVENIGDVIYILNRNREIRFVNKTLEELLGKAQDDLKGKKFADVMSSESFTALNAAVRKHKSIDKTDLFEVRFKTVKGAVRTIEFQESIVREGNRIKEIHGMGRDITAKKKLEEQLVRSQKMEAVGELAGGIAHNFNNILVAIMGYSELLLSSKEENNPDYKALEVIHESTIRASELTKQLLNMVRAGQYKPSEVNMNAVVEKVFLLISGTFDKSIEIRTFPSQEITAVEGDMGQLEQCVLNLCINARDAMPGGGRLIIETINQYLDDDFIRSHLDAQKGQHVVVSITDTGTGIDPDIVDRIFEPFFTTKGNTGGVGMGLSTVYGIVKKHNGLITLYSELNKGTTFRLYFPTAGGELVQPQEKKERVSVRGHGTILIIDDEPGVREVWNDFLTKKGYTIITAKNGQEGVDIFLERKDTIDLVVIDLVMPVRGGKETAKALREIRNDIKVIGCSGYSREGLAKEFANAGVDRFIQKPVQLEEFAEAIAAVLKQ